MFRGENFHFELMLYIQFVEVSLRYGMLLIVFKCSSVEQILIISLCYLLSLRKSFSR